MTTRGAVLNGVGAVVLFAIAGVWVARSAEAIIIVNSRGVDTGMFGIAANQTARVHVVNTTDPAISQQPCIVEVRIVGAEGDLLNQDRIKLMPGRSAFVDYSDPSLSPRTGQRRHLRAIVLQNMPPDFDLPVPACATTTEVFNNRTGQAGIIIVNSHPVR
jgi:hypothetical protein